jgi:hypothetical protein
LIIGGWIVFFILQAIDGKQHQRACACAPGPPQYLRYRLPVLSMNP